MDEDDELILSISVGGIRLVPRERMCMSTSVSVDFMCTTGGLILHRYSYCTHTVLILDSYCTHTVLILYSYCTHTI
jgi:hypothetical protein